MNIRLRFMVVTAAAVLLPLYSAFSAQVGQGAQQDISLEGRIAQLQQRIEEKPKDPNLHFELSQLYEENVEKYYDESLSEFGLAVNHGLKNKHFEWTDPTIFLVSQGTNYLIKEGEYDKAIASYEKVIKLTPNNPHPYGGIGQAHQYKGDYDEAIRWLKQAIDLHPTGEEGKMFYRVFGGIHLDREDFESALLNFNKIKLIDPKNKEVYFGIAKAHQGLEQYDKAIDAYKKYLKYDKGDKETKGLIKECQRLQKQSR